MVSYKESITLQVHIVAYYITKDSMYHLYASVNDFVNWNDHIPLWTKNMLKKAG